MLLKHIFTGKIAHSSYILSGKQTCAVIDPRRDVDVYLQEARDMGVQITLILETHLHADFISGHMDLARKTGARIVAPAKARCEFEHQAVAEGDIIDLEDMELRVLETPGHTPEHVCYVLTDRSRGRTPIGVFTGDVLFVGDVGRPDLFPKRAEELAGKLFHTLHDKLMKLPDYCEVYPAHGAGSLCGRSMAAKYRSTIGYERLYNQALQIREKPEFIRSLTTRMPPAPDHFSRCSEINRTGPALVSDLPVLQELKPADFARIMEDSAARVVDIRGYAAHAGLHIPDAWHVDLAGNFPTFAGWVLPPDRDLILVADDHAKASEAVLWARRVGLDRMTTVLEGGMGAWVTGGRKTSDIHLISAEDLHQRIGGEAELVLVDVRTGPEFQENHIEGAVNIPAPDLRTRHAELDPAKPTCLVCSSGIRSGMAASILEQNGFREIYNVAGGMTGYSAAGYTRQCTVCVNPHGSRFFTHVLNPLT